MTLEKITANSLDKLSMSYMETLYLLAANGSSLIILGFYNYFIIRTKPIIGVTKQEIVNHGRT